MQRLLRIVLFFFLSLTGAAALVIFAGYAFLQTEDGKAWLGQMLSQYASSPTTKVVVAGISGSPPFDLHATSIHIADVQGPWVELENVALAVDGRALLRGEFMVRELRASILHLHRMPQSETAAPTGSLDLTPPRLPLDVAVEDLAVDKLVLEPAVLGEPATLALQARGRLVKGQADLHLALQRTDGQPGVSHLDLSLTGHPAALNLNGEISDPTGALASRLLQRSDHQPVSVNFSGGGPVADWHGRLDARIGELLLVTGDIGIAAGETYRLSITANARQSGLLSAKAEPLMGERLTLEAAIGYDGRNSIRVDRLLVGGAGGLITASGSLDGASGSLSCQARIAISDLSHAGPMLGGPASGALDIEAALGGTLSQPTAKIDVHGRAIHAADMALEQLNAALELGLAPVDGQRHWQGRAQGRVTGLRRTDQPLPSELGQDFDWSFAGGFDESGRALDIDAASLAGGSLNLSARGRIAPAGSTGFMSLEAASLEQFANLAKLPQLAGKLQLNATVASSRFGTTSVELRGDTDELHIGTPAVDALLGPRVKLAGRLRRDEDGRLSLSDVSVVGAGMTLAGSGTAERHFARPSGDFGLELPRLADLSPAVGTRLQGQLKLSGHLVTDNEKGALQLTLDGEGIGTDRIIARRLLAEVQIPDLGRVAGRLNATASLPIGSGAIPARLEAGFARPAADRWNLSGLRLTAAGTSIVGNLDYWVSTKWVSGNLVASVPDLAPWSTLVGQPLKGRGKLTLSLAARQGQSAAGRLEASGLAIGGAGQRIEIGKIALAGRASGLMATARGSLDLSLSEAAAGTLHFNEVKAHVAGGAGTQLDFGANAKGSYLAARGAPDKGVLPLSFDVDGNWRKDGQAQQISLARLKATLGGDSADLLRPLHVGFARGTLRVENLALDLAGGRLTGSAALEGNALTVKLAGQAIPLKPFGQFTRESVLGTVDLAADLSGPVSGPAGNISLKGRGVRFVGLGKTAAQLPPLDFELALAPANGIVRLQGRVAAQGSQLIAATGTIPLRVSVRPLSVAVPANENVDLKVAGEGRLEKLAEILPLGEDQITGAYRIDMSIGGPPAQPEIGGQILVSDASYLNQDYGTQLRGLNLEIVGERGLLRITRLAAGDGKGGELRGSGSLDLAATPSPVLDIQTKLTHFLLANSDEAQAAVDGDIRASGSLVAPRLYARIVMPRGEFRVPDQLPPNIARLDVIEIDSRDPQSSTLALSQARQQAVANPTIPIGLDLEVTVPGQTFVRGHGLDSEWRGKIAVTGNSATPSVDGSLEAVRGSLNVLGKDFVIRRGTISFPTGSPGEAWIDLLAEYVASDITAQATFTGRLSSPHLQLTSTPQLPQDEILARVLFNTDASHITTAQGLQLALAAQTMAGGGPGVLDRLRNAVGLDRLSIGNGAANETPGVTINRTSQSTAGPALSGGKYIAPGVFVGAEQGAGTASSRAKVEVDLFSHVTGYSSVGANNSNRVGLDWRMDY